jgi:hypothetical protein
MAAAVEAEEAVEAHLHLPQGVLLVARQKSHTSANIGYSRPSEKAILPKSSWPNIFQPEKRYNFFVSVPFFFFFPYLPISFSCHGCYNWYIILVSVCPSSFLLFSVA